MGSLMELGQQPGVSITSGPRSPEHNEKVGGKGNSQHLRGTAMDYAVPPQLKAQFMALARKGGFQPIDEGDHIHLQLPNGARVSPKGAIPGSRPRYKPGAEGGQYATLTPQEVQALGLPVGTVAQRSPSGQVQIVNKPKDLPVGGTVTINEDGTTTFTPSGKLSDAQRNAAGFYDRMVNSRKELDALEAKGYDPTNLRDYTTVGGKVLNGLATPEGQQYHQAAQNWVRANLRKESGAAIGVAEMDQEIRNYFPVFGDSPEVVKQKAANRKVVENAMRTAAAGAVPPGNPPSASKGPKPGDIEDGYQFKGGNPSDPKNWVKASR
jgi:hypothetical protein